MWTRIFIRRPILAMVISIVIVLGGLLAVPNLPVARFPQLAPPTVVVTANYPGANALTVEKTVATPIEEQVNGAEHMIYMKSKSTDDGSYQLTISFKVGTNPDLAAVDIQNRVNRATPDLPEAVVRNGITVVKQSTDILMGLALYSPNGKYDKLFLSNYATIHLLDPLGRVPGVGQAELRVGAANYAMRLWVRPDQLARLGLTANDVVKAIQDQNVQASGGAVGAPPQPPGLNFQYPVSVKGGLTSVKDFQNVIVKANSDGSIVRVRDIARTELGAQTYDTFGRRNGKEAIPILIYQRPGANALAVSQAVRQELKKLSKNFPPGIACDPIFDTTLVVSASIHDVIRTLLEAFGLVVLVVFTFLGNARATLIPILAVPVSLIGTFAMLFAFGFSINTLTLFGLVLAIGIVVDDAIVVVEAVEHHIEEGMTPLEATEQAMAEVSGPVVAIALVLCSVFVPVAFLGGLTGELYRQFAVTLSVSVVLSALVALTLTPALCQMILRPEKQMWGPFGWYALGFRKIFELVRAAYERLVGLALRWLVVPVALLVAIGWGAYHLNASLPTGFVPAEDNGYLLIAVTLPAGSSLQRTDRVAARMEKIMMHTPGVESTLMFGGLNILSGNSGPSYATCFIVLKPWDERTTPATSANGIRAYLTQQFAKIPSVTAMVINPPPVPGLGFAGGFQFELQDRSGNTPQALERVTQDFLAHARRDKQLQGLFSPFRTSNPELFVHVDRAKAKVLGVSLNDVFSELQINLGGLFVNLFNEFGRTWRVYVEAAARYRRHPSDIGHLYVHSSDGKLVPLSTLVKPKMITAPDLILRYNLFRTAEIYGRSAPGVSSGQALAAMERLAARYLPQGYGYEWTGTAYQEKESASKQGMMLGLAAVFVFLFLAALYESWAVPFSILLGLPTGILGAYLGSLAAGHSNNIYVQVGLITLLGLAAKNAVLIVEFAKQKYEKGSLGLVEAALAGAKLRFRPILMTSFAFILGVLPLAFASGAGAAGQRSLGVAVCAGMTAATCFGVFLIPSLYVLIQGLAEKLGGGRRP